VRERVETARARQLARAGKANAQLGQAETTLTCALSERDQDLLEQAVETMQLSARSMHRILRVARTIADLAGSESITTAHLTEAIGYRRLERGPGRLAA
jgi:magnesium chelatase family protein